MEAMSDAASGTLKLTRAGVVLLDEAGFTSRFSAVPAAREAFANAMEAAMERAQSATIRAEIGPPPNHCQQLVVSSARSTGRPSRSVPKARGGLPPEVVHTMVQTGEAMHAAI